MYANIWLYIVIYNYIYVSSSQSHILLLYIIIFPTCNGFNQESKNYQTFLLLVHSTLSLQSHSDSCCCSMRSIHFYDTYLRNRCRVARIRACSAFIIRWCIIAAISWIPTAEHLDHCHREVLVTPLPTLPNHLHVIPNHLQRSMPSRMSFQLPESTEARERLPVVSASVCGPQVSCSRHSPPATPVRLAARALSGYYTWLEHFLRSLHRNYRDF